MRDVEAPSPTAAILFYRIKNGMSKVIPHGVGKCPQGGQKGRARQAHPLRQQYYCIKQIRDDVGIVPYGSRVNLSK